jgi:hypothetical protein
MEFAPGEDWQYSDWEYIFLGTVKLSVPSIKVLAEFDD